MLHERSAMKRVVTAFTMLVLLCCTAAAARDESEPFGWEMLRRVEAERAMGPVQRARLLQPDPTPNQSQFDVIHYTLDISINDVTGEVAGVVVALVESLVDSIASVDLNADAVLAIGSVTLGGVEALAWHRSGDVLTVDLPSKLAAGAPAEIVISYGGYPATAANPGLFFRTHGSTPVVYSLSEPWSARTWWPCKDYPDDKATFDIHLAVASGLFAASNGLLVGEADTTCWGLPYRKYHWRESHPMTTYLASVAATAYVEMTDSWEYAPGETLRITNFVYPDLVAEAAIDLDIQVPVISYLSSVFGLYPWIDEKYGVALCEIGGGMEHQTLCSYGAAFVRGDHVYDWLYVHELAHQWFGDHITCRDWVHIWLNEGFARYSEALWFEHLQGPVKLRTYMESLDNPWYWDGPVLRDPANNDPWHYFNLVVYNKGAWILHMLRHVVGDAAFFQILLDYAGDARFTDSHAETEDFIGVCEERCGYDLHWFFDPWLARDDRPSYEWSWSSYTVPAGGEERLVIAVDQLTGEAYTMPVDFRVTTSAGQVDTVLWVAAAHEEYALLLDDPVLDVDFDPDHWILRSVTEGATGTGTAPPALRLAQNRPNPFNPTTSIPFELPVPGHALLQVFDARGALVRTLVNERRNAGPHEAVWNGANDRGSPVASGVYFCRLTAGGAERVRTMVLLR